jgi:hypothetical protein
MFVSKFTMPFAISVALSSLVDTHLRHFSSRLVDIVYSFLRFSEAECLQPGESFFAAWSVGC